MIQSASFQIIGQDVVDSSWTGRRRRLQQNQHVEMPQTTNGTMIFAATNKARQNNAGQLSLTSGGDQPIFMDIPALANQPKVHIHNWKANNLGVTNISVNEDTPIKIQAIGPGIPGTNPVPLEVNTKLSLAPGEMASGMASPEYMRLVLTSNSSTLGIIAIIGGPVTDGNNGFMIAVNDTKNTGPDGDKPPDGYYATTTGNHYSYPFNWGSSTVFLANMSPSTAQDVEVLLQAL